MQANGVNPQGAAECAVQRAAPECLCRHLLELLDQPQTQLACHSNQIKFDFYLRLTYS